MTWTLIRENQLKIKCCRNFFKLSKLNDSLQMFPFHTKDSSSTITKNGIVMEKGLWDYFRKKKILKHSFLKTGHLLQDIFLICTGRLCQVIEELYLWLWPEIFLPPHYSIHVSITHQEAFQAEELIARSGSGCPPCFRLGREFPPGFCLMCFHLLQFCGHAWFIEKNLHFKLFPSPCTRLEH